MWRLRPRTESRNAKRCRALRASGARSRTARVGESVHCGPAKAGEAGLRAEPRLKGHSGGVGDGGRRGGRGPKNCRGGGGVACGTEDGRGGEVLVSGSPCLRKRRGMCGGARGLRTGEGLLWRGGGRGLRRNGHGGGAGPALWNSEPGKGRSWRQSPRGVVCVALSSIWRQGRPAVAWLLRARQSG